jgi:hypothetical protein
MKAERRHELQENSLARGINRFPEFWRQHGTKLSLGIVFVMLLVVFLLQWRSRRAEAKENLARQLTAARLELESAKSNPTLSLETAWTQIEQAVSQVLAESSEPGQVAEAKLLRADANLYWALLASLGDPPEATTRPALKLSSKLQEYLDTANRNYQEVAGQTSLPPLQWGSARLGLAAVAEFKGDLAGAKKAYDEVNRDNPLKLIKETADVRKRAIERAELRKSPLIGQPRDKAAEKAFDDQLAAATQPATAPTATAPAATAPASTAPATQPATTEAATSLPATTEPATPATTRPASN